MPCQSERERTKTESHYLAPQVGQLWREVAELQKLQAELNHRTSAAEQAAQLLVGAAQRERAASAAAAAEAKTLSSDSFLRISKRQTCGARPTCCKPRSCSSAPATCRRGER